MEETYNEVQKRITKDTILTTLLDILEDTEFSDITITDIAGSAGVSRMAFYRNYQSKEDIIIQYLDDVFEEFTEEVKKLEELNKYNISLLCFSYFRRRKTFMERLVDSGLTYIIFERFDLFVSNFFQYLPDNEKIRPKVKDYIIQFTSGGIFKIVIHWIKNNMDKSNEEMAELICELTYP